MSDREEVERRLWRWLADHYSVIGTFEAARLGAAPSLLAYKARRGRLVRVYQGVYRDSAAPTGPFQDLRAAWLACLGNGVVSHRSAAWLWNLHRQPPRKPEVTVHRDTHDTARRLGLTVHRSRDLNVTAAVTRNGILVTNPLRTLVDVAGVASPEQLTEAVDSASSRRLVTVAGLEAEIDRLARPGRDGVAVLRRHLAARGFAGAPEPSVLEAHIRRLIVRTRLPRPSVEVRAGEDGQYRLDIAWVAILLAVEVDGYVWHFSPEHVRRDVERRNHLQQNGWTVLVFTWDQVFKEPVRVAHQITDTYRRLAAK